MKNSFFMGMMAVITGKAIFSCIAGGKVKYYQEDNCYLIRLEKDDCLFKGLLNFAHESKVKGGFVSGIGAIKDVTLGYYKLGDKTYKKQTWEEDFELLSLEGNLSWVDDNPFFHLHVALGKEDFSCIGGHLFEAKVAVTVELNFRQYKQKIDRVHNSIVGLNLLDICPMGQL